MNTTFSTLSKISRQVIAEDPKILDEIELWLWREDGNYRHWTRNFKRELSGTPIPYRPEFAWALVEHMREGHSPNSFAARMGVRPQTITTWLREFEEFRIAAEIGHGARLLKWEIRMNDSADGLSKAPPATLIYATNNHFPDLYKNTKEGGGSGDKATTIIINTGIKKNVTVEITKSSSPTHQISLESNDSDPDDL